MELGVGKWANSRDAPLAARGAVPVPVLSPGRVLGIIIGTGSDADRGPAPTPFVHLH